MGEGKHDCTKEGFLGEVKAFMEDMKGLRGITWGIIATIGTQIVAFAVLWGTQTAIIKQNTDQLWNKITPVTFENTRNIDRILAKFDLLTVLQGVQGVQGVQGEKGN